MPERSLDWFRQAEADLRHARNAQRAGDYNWSAFAAHQAAEKAIKAVFQRAHLDAWGHMLSVLLASLPEAIRPAPELVDRAKELDKHYIPTRYPNGFERVRPSMLSVTRRSSLSGVVVKSVDEVALRRAMDAYAGRLLAGHPEIEEIVVFGSFAEGTWAPGSDLDVFILLSHSPKPVRDRIPELLPGAFPVGVDLFPYTREEVAARTPSPLLEAVARSRWRYGVGLKDLGEQRLRDLARPERIYQLVAPDLPSDFPPLRTLEAVPHAEGRNHAPLPGPGRRPHPGSAVRCRRTSGGRCGPPRPAR